MWRTGMGSLMVPPSSRPPAYPSVHVHMKLYALLLCIKYLHVRVRCFALSRWLIVNSCTMCLLPLCLPLSPGLRKKTVAPGAVGLDDHLRGSGSTDLFGSADAIVKHVLEVRDGRKMRGALWELCVAEFDLPVYVYMYTYTCTCMLYKYMYMYMYMLCTRCNCGHGFE